MKLIYLIIPFLLACSENEKVEVNPPAPSLPANVGLITFDDEDFIVYSSTSDDLLLAFRPYDTNGKRYDLQLSEKGLPILFTDASGGDWNIYGRCINGANVGATLQRPQQMIGFWFAVASMFAEVTLLQDTSFRDIQDRATSDGWLVDTDFVSIGAPRDGIPAIRQPILTEIFTNSVPDIPYLNDASRVTVSRIEDRVFVFPMAIMNWHEIVNIDEQWIYSYCPLTGTSVLHRAPASVSNFGVSGLLYNNNLVMYDETTESYWSQMLSTAVEGDLQGLEMQTGDVIEMNWKAAQESFGRIFLVDRNPQFMRDYSRYPYGDYQTNHGDIFYPLSFIDPRVPAKERVLAIFTDKGTLAIRNSDVTE